VRAAIYCRVSTLDQNPQTLLLDLQQLASQRGFEVVQIYTDHGFSGARQRRPALDQMLADGRRGKFDVVLCWACDRVARSVKHFLEVLEELTRLNIQFVSFREAIDTQGPLGRAVVVIISVVAELERSLIVERVKAGMRRARLEGRHIGRRPLELDQAGIIGARTRGLSLRKIAKAHQISTATVRRVLKAHPPQKRTLLHAENQ
jgi:DNA invertase Pin-like site-specific DNA recombinase